MKRILCLIALTAFFLCQTAAQRPSWPPEHWLLYGRVNHWADSPRTLKQEVRLMARNGLDGYMIELAGWAAPWTDHWSDAWLRETERRYARLLRMCRRRNLVLFVSIVNDNMGRGKYGDTGPALEQVYGQALQLMQVVRKHGADHVVVQPVAETQTQAGRNFETDCLRALQGFTLAYNGGGGFPDRTPEGFHCRAVHPAHIGTAVPQGVMAVSDHGILIRELAADRSLDGPASDDRLTQWVENMKRMHVKAIGYYAFQRQELDRTAIVTLGKCKRP